MKQSLALIKSSLVGIYPSGEVDGFIRLIFEELCGYTLTDILLRRDEVLPPDKQQTVVRIVERLVQHEPIQYILGVAHWRDLRLTVGEGVLIPRPETAEIVTRIIEENGPISGRVADLCTGSGCIAIALAKAWPHARVEGWDISQQALRYASLNATNNAATVQWRECDILAYEPVDSPRYEVMVSNPPYVLERERAEMDENVLRYEPHTALFVPDNDPLKFYRAIARIAQRELLPSGRLYFEINETQGVACCRMLEDEGFDSIGVVDDYAGKARMVKAVKGDAKQ